LNAEKNLVKHAIAQGEIEEIIAHSRRGLELIDTHLNDTNEHEAFEEMLLLGLMSKGDYQAAEKELTVIVEKAEGAADKSKLLTSLGQLADAHYALGELEAARDEYQRALDLSVRLQEKVVEARILGRLAALAADEDELDKSNQFLLKGLKISESLNEQAIQGELHYLLALNYQELENQGKAAEHAQKSVESYLAAGAGSPGEKARTLLESLLSS
jgi:tetratricopeptide (TPR) repeat protein